MKVNLFVTQFPHVSQQFTYERLKAFNETDLEINLIYFNNVHDQNAKYNTIDLQLKSIKNVRRLTFLDYFYPYEFLKYARNKKILKRRLYLKKVHKNHPDVVHFEQSALIYLLDQFWEDFKNTKYIISLRGHDIVYRIHQDNIWYKLLIDASKKNNVYFHAPSAYIKRKAIAAGIDESKIRIIPQGIRTEMYKPISFNKITQWISVARLHKVKGIDIALHSLKIIHDPKLKYTIIGDGEEREYLKKLVKKLELENQVNFLGWRTNDWIKNYLRDNSSNSVFILPSRSEAFGQSILEAGVNGIPIIASKTGGIPEILSDTENAMLFEPENPASLALKYDNLLKINRETLVSNLQQQIKNNFSVDREVKLFKEFYLNL